MARRSERHHFATNSMISHPEYYLFPNHRGKKAVKILPLPAAFQVSALLIFLLVVSAKGEISSWRKFLPSFLSKSRPLTSPTLVEKLTKNREGIWAYTGSLYDSVTGNKIVNVEGIELVKTIVSPRSKTQSKEQGASFDDLLIARVMQGLEKQNATTVGTVLSRKLFCYIPLDRPRQLLSSMRLRPQGALQAIPLSQAAIAYESVVSFLEQDQRLLCHSEFADGRSFWSQCIEKETSEDDRVEFSVVIRGGPTSADSENSAPKFQPMFNVTKSPARSRLIQFGMSQVTGFPAAVREVYEYQLGCRGDWRRILRRFRGNQPSIRYTRYGEGPAWYGPKRMCVLELRGRRVQNWEDVPPVAAKFAAESIPGFASMSLDWFRTNSFQIIDNDSLPGENNFVRWLRRLRRSFSFEASRP